MSLRSIWNDLQYKMASLGLSARDNVRQELQQQGWTFETENILVTAPDSAASAVCTVTTVKTPEGVSTTTDNAAQARYNQAYQTAVDKIFNRPPAP